MNVFITLVKIKDLVTIHSVAIFAHVNKAGQANIVKQNSTIAI